MFTTPRHDAAKLPLDQVRLTAARELNQHKSTAVVGYAAGNRCRQQLLLEYFDEADPPRCGVCDVCLAEKKARQAAEAGPGLRGPLLALVAEAARLPREVLAAFAPQQTAAVTETLRELVERGELRYLADGRVAVSS